MELLNGKKCAPILLRVGGYILVVGWGSGGSVGAMNHPGLGADRRDEEPVRLVGAVAAVAGAIAPPDLPPVEFDMGLRVAGARFARR